MSIDNMKRFRVLDQVRTQGAIVAIGPKLSVCGKVIEGFEKNADTMFLELAVKIAQHAVYSKPPKPAPAPAPIKSVRKQSDERLEKRIAQLQTELIRAESENQELRQKLRTAQTEISMMLGDESTLRNGPFEWMTSNGDKYQLVATFLEPIAE